jgi:hypothetical protein
MLLKNPGKYIGAGVVMIFLIGGSHCRKEVEEIDPKKLTFYKVESSLYPIVAWIPSDWEATETKNTIIPCDSWVFTPRGGMEDGRVARVIVELGWRPRPGRMSAFFPGGRAVDAKEATFLIAGRRVQGIKEDNERLWLADFEVGELALSVSTIRQSPAQERVMQEILKRLEIDPDAKPEGWPDEKRIALDLAWDYAKKHKIKSPRVVWAAQGALPHTHHLTIFYEGGLKSLLIDAAKRKVLKDTSD